MRLLICVLLLLPGLAGASSADLISDPFFESYQPEVNVSGNVIVGVMSAAAGSSLAADELGVHAAAMPEATDICLRAASSDGIYTSRNHYRLPPGASGAIHLPYRSGMSDVLRQYANGDIAISASAGDCESSTTDYYVVTPLEASAAPITRIYLNSFGATDVFYQLGASHQAPNACEYISDGRRTTYDFFCTLEVPADSEPIAVNIIRERFGREQPGVQLKLIGAAP